MYSIEFDPKRGDYGMYVVRDSYRTVLGEFATLIEATAYCTKCGYLYFVVG